MSRRRGPREGEGGGGLTAAYEGPEVLTELLRRAGSARNADEVAAAFSRAQEAGEARADVIPTFFDAEPHFDSPDDARRLYGNLFGLWARVAAGHGAADDAPAALPEAANEPVAPPTLPERGGLRGSILTREAVESVWKFLAAATPREVQRRRDRFPNVQPDLSAWLEALPLPDTASVAAADLAFEAWAMFDQAFGDRLAIVEYRELRAREAEPPPLEQSQPALAAYVAEQLDNLADEDPTFGAADRAQVERVLAALAAALGEAVREGE
jgi:hypothetical protein